MESMNVQEMTNRLKRLYPRIKAPTKVVWDKSIKPIAELQLEDVTDDVAYDYLDKHMDAWSESTVKARIGTLKGLWNKASRKKLYRGENPWLDLDDGLQIKVRDPEPYPWEFYEYYHDHPYFVFLWYTGARIGEVAGLEPQNIVIDAPIPYFNFVDQDNRDLKNKASQRQVPIHKECFRYIDQFKQSKAKAPGQSWSENFRRNLGLPKGTAAHSLRHSFHTRCRDVGMPGYIINVLTGHGKKSISDDYGTIKLELLKEYIDKL
jgi:integrase